jgi:hypothetical protein
VASPCAFSLSSAEGRVRVCGSRVSVWRGDQPTDFGELSVVLSVPSYGSRRVVYEPAS